MYAIQFDLIGMYYAHFLKHTVRTFNVARILNVSGYSFHCTVIERRDILCSSK